MEDLVVRPDLVIPGGELRERFVRAGGPGGENVNKVATKVELRWAPGRSAALSEAERRWLLERLAAHLTAEGEVVITSSRTRDQGRNRADARRKLQLLIARALERPKVRRPTVPAAAARRRRLEEKRRRAEIKRERQLGFGPD